MPRSPGMGGSGHVLNKNHPIGGNNVKTLTDTQKTIIQAAAERPSGDIEPLPSNVKAGIRQRVIDGLLTRKLIEFKDGIYCINAAGFTAIGVTSPEAKPSPKPRRENTKQAQVIALMQRPQGASIEEICVATDWQQHTVRGMFSNVLRKRLGLTITADKDSNNIRRYRIRQDLDRPADK